jgi:hypothetical protein
MKRTVAAVALIGLTLAAPSAAAGPGGSLSVAAPTAPRAHPAAAYASAATTRWTEPAGTFSFDLPKTWDDVETASEVGAPSLEVVTGSSGDQCWFTRVSSPATAALAPAALIRLRTAALGAPMWAQIGARQHILTEAAQVRESGVGLIGVWPVQIAVFDNGGKDVFAALHSRPGLDIWVFCAAKNGVNRSPVRAVALSVRTARDAEWERQLPAQASLTAVP